MTKPPKKEYDLAAKIALLRQSGFSESLHNRQPPLFDEADILLPLPERIQLILGIIQQSPLKATTMNYLILYDIEDNKVRGMIAKYLIEKGCIRIQKSVFLAHTDHKKFEEIHKTLEEINDIYQNKDSIILIPINVSDARSMKLIGKNVNISQIVDPPSTVFI
jgi:CRISPR-associated endonuclease Cas2